MASYFPKGKLLGREAVQEFRGGKKCNTAESGREGMKERHRISLALPYTNTTGLKSCQGDLG